MPLILYVLFFVSGSAALIYEVAWVRSLSVVFGGSHLAVTIVLSVYMGGIALGSLFFGRRADAAARPLRLYGLLELGIGAFALVFLGLLRVYPVLYGPLARVAETNRFWLSAIRIVFAAAAMIVPATLMGGTLPVLSKFAAVRSGQLGQRGVHRGLPGECLVSGLQAGSALSNSGLQLDTGFLQVLLLLKALQVNPVK